MTKTVIVGGGLAGLATAVKLLDAGIAVELIEKRDVLGGKLMLWNARAGELVRAFDAPAQQSRFSALAFSPDGTLLMTGSPNSGVSFWDAQTGELAGGFPLAQDSGIFAATFSADGTQLALALGDQTVRVFELPGR